jgi:hypothetical protein
MRHFCSGCSGARSRLFLSHDLALVAFDGFTLSSCYRDAAERRRVQICIGASLVVSGVLRKREAVEGSAALTRLS